MWDPRQNTSLTTWDTNRHWVWDPRQHFNMEEEYSALDKTKYFPAVSQQNASVCWAARTFYGGDREETSYFMCSLHNANMLEENQHCSIQSVARLYFLMNETLINLRSGKNTGPSPLTGLWVQWQCGDNEDLTEMAAWNIPSLHKGVAARSIPPSQWCCVPNVQERRNQSADWKCLNLCSCRCHDNGRKQICPYRRI